MVDFDSAENLAGLESRCDRILRRYFVPVPLYTGGQTVSNASLEGRFRRCGGQVSCQALQRTEHADRAQPGSPSGAIRQDANSIVFCADSRRVGDFTCRVM